MKPSWTDECWDTAASLADRLSPRSVERARTVLRAVFPQALTDMLVQMDHPVVAKQLTYPGRGHLLELGVAVGTLHKQLQDVKRLRNADEYESVASEYRAGLMFRRAGAVLECPSHEPGRARCEFVAKFPDGYRLAIEVKLPKVSDVQCCVMRVQHELLIKLIDRFHWLSAMSPSARAHFCFAPNVMELIDQHAVDHLKLSCWVDDAVLRATDSIRRGPLFGTIDLGRVGLLQFHKEAGLAGIQFSASGPPQDAKKRSRQLQRNLLNKAAKQTTEAQFPGVIVLDTERDGLIKNTLTFLQDWANRQPSLAAVLMIERDVIANRMYGNVDIVFGPRFDEAMPALSTLFDVCEKGHLHYNPLSSLVTPCPCVWLPNNCGEQ